MELIIGIETIDGQGKQEHHMRGSNSNTNEHQLTQIERLRTHHFYCLKSIQKDIYSVENISSADTFIWKKNINN